MDECISFDIFFKRIFVFIEVSLFYLNTTKYVLLFALICSLASFKPSEQTTKNDTLSVALKGYKAQTNWSYNMHTLSWWAHENHIFYYPTLATSKDN